MKTKTQKSNKPIHFQVQHLLCISCESAYEFADWTIFVCCLSLSMMSVAWFLRTFLRSLLQIIASLNCSPLGAFCWNSNPDYGFTSRRSLPVEQRDVKSVVFPASGYAECTLGSSAAIIYPGIVVDLWLLGLHKRFLRHCWSFLLTAQMIGKCFC